MDSNKQRIKQEVDILNEIAIQQKIRLDTLNPSVIQNPPNWGELYQTMTEESDIEIGKRLGKDKKTIRDNVIIEKLDDLGITAKQSSRYQQLSKTPEDKLKIDLCRRRHKLSYGHHPGFAFLCDILIHFA